MNYPLIKQAKLSHKQIAKAFGYKNVNSFRGSTAHRRHMQGVENILKILLNPKASEYVKSLIAINEKSKKEKPDPPYSTFFGRIKK